MVRFRVFFVLVCAFLSTACTTTRWVHPTLSESDFYRDREDCNQYAQAVNPNTAPPYNPNLDPYQQANAMAYAGGANLGRAYGLMASMENCLLGKGYRKVQR